MRTTAVVLLACAAMAMTQEDRLPDIDMSVKERIAYWGYPSVREYDITTSDGYILSVQRIQNKRHAPFDNARKPAVLLQHGLTGASSNWIINLPEQALAYVLADAGYDVWLGNVRGNSMANRHVRLNKFEKAFWEFSWQEMAEYDIPAMIDYILAVTGEEKLTYIGHSQGTLVAFAKFSDDPDYGFKKINKFIALAPVSTVGYIDSGLAKLAPYANALDALLDLIGIHSLGDVTWILKLINPQCTQHPDPAVLDACANAFFSYMGTEQKSHVNETRLPIVIKHVPEGTSVKNFVHFGQLVNSKKMQKYDYGLLNLQKYHQFTPPTYDVSRITCPVALYYSTEDHLADIKDIEANLLPKLKTVVHTKVLNDFSHVDFILALSATKAVYEDILMLMPTP